MKLPLSIFGLFLLFLLIANGNMPVSSSWKPGVAKDDYFIYQMYGVFTSNRSGSTLPIPKFEYNTTKWVRINIMQVSGSIVYQLYTLHFNNGNELNFNLKTDLNPESESALKFSDKGVPICAANLLIGDHLPTTNLTINETLIRSYLGGSRETNRASWNSVDDWGNCYFDKETGMLVELCRTHQFSNTATGELINKTDVIELINTNRWET